MKFLVIFISVVISYIWKQDLERISDSWFFTLRRKIEFLFQRRGEQRGNTWFIVFTLTYSLPLILLTLVLGLIDSWLFGLLTIAVHIFVLLMAFDRIHPGLLAQQFLERWEKGDYEACYLFLEQELSCTTRPAPEDAAALHTTFSRLYVYRCFERMFVTIFWYLVAGPLGVMFAYISYQLRGDVLVRSSSPETDSVNALIMVLEWLPLRLLGLTLGLMGNFEACFARLRDGGLSFSRTADQTVYEYAVCALGIEAQLTKSDKPDTSSATKESHVSDFQTQGAREIESLQGLMERSQFVWLSIIALVTILASWQF